MPEQVIDVRVLDELLETFGGDVEALGELVDAFVEDTADLVEQALAAAVDDPDAYRRAVHSLKTTSATLGATELSTICRRLEADAREGRTVAVDDLDLLVKASQKAAQELQSRFTRD